MSLESYKETGFTPIPCSREDIHTSLDAGNGDVQYGYYTVTSAFMPYKKDSRLTNATLKSLFLVKTNEQDQEENDLEVETIFNSGFIPRLERRELPYIFAFEELYGEHAMPDENEWSDAGYYDSDCHDDNAGAQRVVRRDWDYWFMDEECVVHECMDEGLFWKGD